MHIFYFPDLHIRYGDKFSCRYIEYKSVFDNTISSIQNKILDLHLHFNQLLIIITGDIFHHKFVISNYEYFII
jgi:hypothetical protein